MTEFSRMKKFQDLRESIQNDREGEIHSDALSPFAQRLSRIDTTFNPGIQPAVSSSHLTQHGKKDVRFDDKISETNGVDSFRNEYIDEFLEEVKNYNIKKGYRSYEDTESNIFTQAQKELKFIPTPRTAPFATQRTPEPVVTKDLSDEELNLTQEILQVIHGDEEKVAVETVEEAPLPVVNVVPNEKLNDVLEETQKLRIQLDEYEKGLNDVTLNVSKSNRLLNFIVAMLVIVLLTMLGVAIYWILTTRGLI